MLKGIGFAALDQTLHHDRMRGDVFHFPRARVHVNLVEAQMILGHDDEPPWRVDDVQRRRRQRPSAQKHHHGEETKYGFLFHFTSGDPRQSGSTNLTTRCTRSYHARSINNALLRASHDMKLW